MIPENIDFYLIFDLFLTLLKEGRFPKPDTHIWWFCRFS
jgi:hypothetical protein